MTVGSSDTQPDIVGGGTKKILYTLNTVRKIGLGKSAKALKANNTCKACGLGMGGQRGGMVNELDEFPSVCNKSIQAQSTDIQPAIPEEVFAHPIAEFRKLSGKELESLGRLNTPLHKSANSNYLKPVTWEWALEQIVAKFAATTPKRSFFYSSGRASNEAGFVLQMLSRLYGTNNVNNCSYYCHQATGVGLGTTVGTGTATVELEDLGDCDLVFVIGANPSSNHPRLIHQLKNCRDRGGDIIVINPAKEPGLVRFAVPKSPRSLIKGGSEIASSYLQPNIGTDLALLTALGKWILENGAIDQTFIEQHTHNFAAYREQLESADWDELCDATGLTRDAIAATAEIYARAEKVVFAWGMGITHHRHGSENVEAIANLALLRGMIGKRYAGLLPLRGHSNVQGIGTIGVKPVLPAQVFDAMEQHLGVDLPTQTGLDTLGCLQQAHDGDVDIALLMGGNLYEATPDTRWSEEAFNRIGSKVYLTTTLNRGHVHGIDQGEVFILPVTARDEEWQPTTQESMFNFVRLSDGGIERLSNTRPESDILCEIGTGLLPDCGVDIDQFRSHNRVREAIAEVVPGMEKMVDIGVAKEEFHINGRVLHVPEFKTADSKASFVAHQWQASIRLDQDYPLTLMSVRSEGQFNSIVYENSDQYRGTEDRWVLMMGPADIKGLGLKAGDTVTLCSAYGEMAGLVIHPFDLPPGNLMAYYPECNVLIGRDVDPRSKTPAFKSVSVRVQP
ncbi:MAG: FdhF/YdeP family oxidoreductase [Motiliproteus sp.]|nr:FdhF/YdeP family oxidoreductase [Motiliproteus sp.]MCW9050820.1 FdhF/YdeP family oxidoreductase [Motiliproteus sp.]